MARIPAGLDRRKFLTSAGLLGGAGLLGVLGNGCGYLLYPERRGRNGGFIDGGILLVDLIWLLPGLIPGIICLAVDFSTGCIYTNSERRGVDATEPGEPREPMQVAVELHGKEVARGELQQDGRAHLVWSENADVEMLRAHGRLIAVGRDQSTAQAPISALI